MISSCSSKLLLRSLSVKVSLLVENGGRANRCLGRCLHTNKGTKRRFVPPKQRPPIYCNKTPQNHQAQASMMRPAWTRFLDPWYDLASVIDDDHVLSNKVDASTRTFGFMAAIMCSTSAALLVAGGSSSSSDRSSNSDAAAQRTPTRKRPHWNANNNTAPSDPYNPTATASSRHGKTTASSLFEILFQTPHPPGTSLLVSWGVPKQKLHGIYTACCAASFYTAVLELGLSAVMNAWLAATPPGIVAVRLFVQHHSLYICAIPALLYASTGLAGIALFLGLDRAKGTPISYIGLGGTVVCAVLIGSAAVSGWVCTFRLLTPLVKQLVLK